MSPRFSGLLLAALTTALLAGCGEEEGGAEPLCQEGQERCLEAGTAMHEVCTQGAWKRADCGQQVCAPETGRCTAPTCARGQLRCEGNPRLGLRSVCGADRLAFAPRNCLQGQVCVQLDATAAECVFPVCAEGERRCAPDFSGVQTCNAAGTGWQAPAPCEATHSCAEGECRPATTVLGNVHTLPAGGARTLALSPGFYGLALVSLDNYEGEMAVPARIDGEVLSSMPAGLLGQRLRVETPPALHACGTLQRLAALPEAPEAFPAPLSAPKPVLPAPVPGDRRTFYFGGVGTRQAVLIAATSGLNLWEDVTTRPQGSVVRTAGLTDLVRRMDGIEVRNRAIFGAPSDIDANGKIDVFFTDLLPSDNAAAFVDPSNLLGSYGYDRGEIVFSMGTDRLSAGELTAIIAHETEHLIYFGRRLASGMASSAVWAEAYAAEGIAVLAANLSGQTNAEHIAYSLSVLEHWSLGRFMRPAYLDDPYVSGAMYGMAGTFVGYLFDQAGGLEILPDGRVADRGGSAFVRQFTDGTTGFARLAPADGRTGRQAWMDLGGTLLVSSLGGSVSQATANEARYHFRPVVADPVFGGRVGTPLRGEDIGDAPGPLVVRRAWTLRDAKMQRGGVAVYDVRIGASGAGLTVTDAQTAALLVRYRE